ncbi:MAG: hypothetical protein KJ579_10585 [Verrucomicrobia bacterium]|nr:hypothetical protein [Verrucomicrobiota bacterium]
MRSKVDVNDKRDTPNGAARIAASAASGYSGRGECCVRDDSAASAG